MYCTQCTSRQVLLMCTQRLGWGFVRPGRTHTHQCLHSHATCLTPHTQRLGWGFVRPGRTHTHGCLRSHATYLTPHTVSGLWRGTVDTHAYVCVQDARIHSQDAS